MDHFNGPRPLYRWQLGLIALSLPRRLIPRGLLLPLAGIGLKLRASCPVEAVPDPVGQGPVVLVRCSLTHLLLLLGDPNL